MGELSIIVLTHNNETSLKDTLLSVQFGDEVIVIDDFSTDRTLQIADEMKSIIYSNKLDGDFSKQRNFGLAKAKYEWVMFVDSDEIVSEELKKEILTSLKKSHDVKGFFLRRVDVMWNKELIHGEIKTIRLLRLGKKDAGSFIGKVHERWDIQGKTSELKNPLLHYPHQSVKEFLKDINIYSSMRAKELFENNDKVTLLDIVCFPIGKFFVNYILRMGLRDGVAGLVFAMCMSFHSFLVRSKLWALYDAKKKISAK